MANFDIKEPKEFNEEIKKLTTEDRGHADVFNGVFDLLVNNDAFLKESCDLADEHLKNGDVHVTKEMKEKWDSASLENPVFTGSLSINRKAGAVIGDMSVAEGYNTTASGKYSHAEGKGSNAIGSVSHAEGYVTKAVGEYSHAEGANITTVDGITFVAVSNPRYAAIGFVSHTEGINTITKGMGSHAEGIIGTVKTTDGVTSITELDADQLQVVGAIGIASHTEGNNTMAYGEASHAEGGDTTAFGNSSHAEGKNTIAEGYSSHAEGSNTAAFGNSSHAEGSNTAAFGNSSHAEGINATASGEASHAEGINATASGEASHAEGGDTTAYGIGSHAEGLNTIAGVKEINDLKICAHAEGINATAYGEASHAEGGDTTASGTRSHAEGFESTASGYVSHAEGKNTIAEGYSSHAEGSNTAASGDYSHAEGNGSKASGYASHAGGDGCYARGNSSFVHGENLNTRDDSGVNAIALFGKYNNINTITDRTLFVIGGGNDESTRENIFRSEIGGTNFAGKSFNSGGADFAEIYEWEDGNTEEDRRGLFVTNNTEKITIAQPGDYILGAVSSNPCLVGNNPEDWDNRWIRDIFGNIITEEVEVDVMDMIDKEIKHEDTIISETVIDEDGKETIVEKVIPGEVEIIKEYGPTGEKKMETRNKQNPDYDQDKTYAARSNRKEWAYVGLHGQIVVIDDGTCEVNGFCKPAVGGIATKANTTNGYRVLNRLDDTHIKIQMESIRIFD